MVFSQKKCQHFIHEFPIGNIKGKIGSFNPKWFKEYENWLGSSIEKYAAFCLACCLFRPKIENQVGGDSFVVDGFTAWNKKERLNSLVHTDIQKDIVNTAAINAIIYDLGNDLFVLLLDESRDISMKEQVAVALRYVNKKGYGCVGASNTQGQFNGHKTLLIKENTSAFYIHYFAYQLQLTLVTVAKNLEEMAGSLTWQCLNQETILKCPSDTWWGSHYGILLRLLDMSSSVMERAETSFLDVISSFDFIFKLHLKWKVFGITNELSQVLQRKDEDITNEMKLVRILKDQLQKMRDEKWDSLLIGVFSFCEKINFGIPDINCLFLNYRFDEVNIDLLCCVTCLNPNNSFEAFDK
ncbi:hypothetical protein CDL12_23720 [Handroanthus impetiginosus]|uniref:TTF-type domain-containing protein n=1 Tax=Handroanthus impetiginosus TaxID=429701 RepID=A0A2G9GEW2_9LAMI|nr:hypothetical protein CDL12_23720 [Handroanthus impetiginosus]